MNALFDHGRLAAIAHGSGATQAEVLAEFRRGNAADAEMLRQACRKGDFARVESLAHRIRGASMMLGANLLAEACSLIATMSISANEAEVRKALVLVELQLAGLNDCLNALGRGTGATSPSAAVEGTEPSSLLCSNLKFLVVDDHEFQRNVVMRLLRRLGAEEVHGFGDGTSVLQAMGDPATSCDIMVLDLAMPGINGMELMQMIAEGQRQISIIMNSALGSDLLAWPLQTARSYGVTVLGATSKPLTEAKLAPLIAQYRHSLLTVSAHPPALRQ